MNPAREQGSSSPTPIKFQEEHLDNRNRSLSDSANVFFLEHLVIFIILGEEIILLKSEAWNVKSDCFSTIASPEGHPETPLLGPALIKAQRSPDS